MLAHGKRAKLADLVSVLKPGAGKFFCSVLKAINKDFSCVPVSANESTRIPRYVAFRRSLFFRTVALILEASLALQNIAWADGPGTSTPDMIQSRSSMMGMSSDPASLSSDAEWKFLKGLGRIESRFDGKRPGLIIHLEDAHLQRDAQLNNAKIIMALSAHRGISTVGMEGAAGEILHQALSSYPSAEARRILGDYYLGEGTLNGPEYAALTGEPRLKLYGLENPKLYELNRKAFLDGVSSIAALERPLQRAGKTLEAFSRQVFSAELRRFYALEKSWALSAIDVLKYCAGLYAVAGVLPAERHTPQIDNAARIFKLQASLDPQALREEIEKAASCQYGPASDRLRAWITQLGQPGLDSEESGLLGVSMLREIEAMRLRGKSFPQLKVQAEILFRQSLLGSRLFMEIGQLRRQIRERLIRTRDESNLDHWMSVIDVCEKLLKFRLTEEDVLFFEKYRADFNSAMIVTALRGFSARYPEDESHTGWNLEALDGAIAKAWTFYAYALERDRTLVENALDLMDRTPGHSIILVTGGFHTPGIQKKLRDRGISYVTVCPVMRKTEDEAAVSARYLFEMKKTCLPAQRLWLNPAEAGGMPAKDVLLQLQTPRHFPVGFSAGSPVAMTPEVRSFLGASAEMLIGIDSSLKGRLPALGDLVPAIRGSAVWREKDWGLAFYREALGGVRFFLRGARESGILFFPGEGRNREANVFYWGNKIPAKGLRRSGMIDLKTETGTEFHYGRTSRAAENALIRDLLSDKYSSEATAVTPGVISRMVAAPPRPTEGLKGFIPASVRSESRGGKKDIWATGVAILRRWLLLAGLLCVMGLASSCSPISGRMIHWGSFSGGAGAGSAPAQKISKVVPHKSHDTQNDSIRGIPRAGVLRESPEAELSTKSRPPSVVRSSTSKDQLKMQKPSSLPAKVNVAPEVVSAANPGINPKPAAEAVPQIPKEKNQSPAVPKMGGVKSPVSDQNVKPPKPSEETKVPPDSRSFREAGIPGQSGGNSRGFSGEIARRDGRETRKGHSACFGRGDCGVSSGWARRCFRTGPTRNKG